MSNFTPLVEKEYEFDGDKINVKFSRLKRKHMLRVQPSIKRFQKSQEEGPDGSVKVIDPEAYAESTQDMLEQLIDVIPDYVREFSGLVDSSNNPVDIKTVVDEFYFMKLCSEIALDLVTASSFKSGNL